MDSKRKLAGRCGVLLGVAAMGCILGAAAAVMYVNAERLDVVDKKRAVAKTVATVDRNTAVNVLAKEGRWYKVEVAGQQGYIAETQLSQQPTAAKGKGVSLAAVKSGKIDQLETAAAVKGIGEGAKEYAAASGMSTSGLQELIRRRESVTPAEFDQFLATGGLPAGVAAASAEAPTRAIAAGN